MAKVKSVISILPRREKYMPEREKKKRELKNICETDIFEFFSFRMYSYLYTTVVV